MSLQKARDLLLHIGDGGGPEVFTVLGSARLVALTLANRPVDATSLAAAGVEEVEAGAGVQEMRIALEGLFRDTAAEEVLRAAAFGRLARNYKIFFPNGDCYAAAFAVRDYARGGGAEGLESFEVTLQRTGSGAFTPGA